MLRRTFKWLFGRGSKTKPPRYTKVDPVSYKKAAETLEQIKENILLMGDNEVILFSRDDGTYSIFSQVELNAKQLALLSQGETPDGVESVYIVNLP